jgi:hypothetical protein
MDRKAPVDVATGWTELDDYVRSRPRVIRYEQVYVKVTNRSIDFWTPVYAVREAGYYRILTQREVEHEEWEFDTGTLVECELKRFPNGKRELVATRAKLSKSMEPKEYPVAQT